MKIRFTESTRRYRGHGYRFDEPGEYEVDDAIAKRLLKDFPQWFETVKPDKAAFESKSESVEVKTGDQEASVDAGTEIQDEQEDAGEETEDTSAEASESQEDEKPSINLSKANRAQLEAVAAEIGLEITADMDTNKKIKEAIEAKQKEG